MMAKLGDVCTIVSGTTPKTSVSEYWDGNINWITPAELNEDTVVINESKRKITKAGVNSCGLSPFPAGTVILSSRAPIGKTAIAGTEMYCNQGFKNLICSDKIHNKYLFWFLRSKTEMLNSLGRGATFKEISKSIVENIEIPLPDLPTQQRIADTLDKVSEGIEVCRRILGELDLMVKAKFGEMFGALGEDKFNWGMTTLGVCCELNPKRPRDIPDDMDVSFVAMPSVTEKGQIDTSVIKPYLEVRKGFTYFAENDVLFAKITPCMENGKGCVAKGLTNAIGAGSTEFHVLRPIHGKSNPYWLYYLTVIPGFRENARKVMTGTGGQLRVPIAYLDNLPVSLPPIELQEQFATFVSKIDKSRLTIQQVLSKMEMVKLALMQEYFG